MSKLILQIMSTETILLTLSTIQYDALTVKIQSGAWVSAQIVPCHGETFPCEKLRQELTRWLPDCSLSVYPRSLGEKNATIAQSDIVL